jgi:hypothetical protein
MAALEGAVDKGAAIDMDANVPEGLTCRYHGTLQADCVMSIENA